MKKAFAALALVLLSVFGTSHAASIKYIHEAALRGGFTTNIAAPAAGWQPIKIGTGGILTRINIAPDGTKVASTDSFGGYIWPVGGTQWLQLATGTRFPAGTQNLGQGFSEIKIAPSNTQIIWLLWNGMLFESTDQGNHFVKNTAWTTVPGPWENQNSPTKGFGPYIAIDPFNPNFVYFSTPSQGLYRTTDGGVTINQVTAVSAGLPANLNQVGTTPSVGTDTTSLTIGTGSKVFSHNSASFGFPISTSTYVQVWDTANPLNQMFGYVTAASGTSFTLNVTNAQGSGTFATWTVGPAVGNSQGVIPTGGGHRISFDVSGGHTCGTGGNQTCNIFVHTYHVGTWKSTDGGTTWNLVNATGAPTSIRRWDVDPYGVLWVVTDDYLGNVNIAKYDGTTWTNPISAAGCCGQTGWSAVAVDAPNSASKSTTHVTFMEQGPPPAYTYSADGGGTWNIIPGMGQSYANNSFTSLTGDVTWLSNWYTALKPNIYFAGNDIAYDPLNTGRVYSASEGAWYFTPSTSATTNVYTQQSIGIEEFIASRVSVPLAGSLFFQNWDYPCFATATFTVYPSNTSCNMGSITNLVIGYGYDWLWSNPAEAAATNQDSGGANSSGSNISGSTMTAGGNGTWTNFPTQPCAGVGQSGSEIAITAHLKYFVTCIGTIPKVTTDGGTNWAPISITGGTPSSGWGIYSPFGPFSRTMATDHTNGDVYIYNTGNGTSDEIYRYTASTGLWGPQGSPGFSFAYIVEQLKTVYGQTGHLLFTPNVSGSVPYFSNNGGSSWNPIPGFGQVSTMGSGAAFSGNYSSIYVLGYYTGTVNLESGGTQAVTNQYWTYMCKNFQTSTRLCSGNWTQIGTTQYAGDMLVPVVDIEGDPATPGLVYSYGHGGAFWGQFN